MGCVFDNADLSCFAISLPRTRFFLDLLHFSHRLPNRNFWEDWPALNYKKCLILSVPGERIELPTNGLQNRCSTAELTRLARHIIQKYQIVDPSVRFYGKPEGRFQPSETHHLPGKATPPERWVSRSLKRLSSGRPKAGPVGSAPSHAAALGQFRVTDFATSGAAHGLVRP